MILEAIAVFIVLFVLAFVATVLYFRLTDERVLRQDAEQMAHQARKRLIEVLKEYGEAKGRIEMAEQRVSEFRQAAAMAQQDMRTMEQNFVRQIQSMAERIATLRRDGLPDGGEDTFFPETSDEAPLLPELRDFISGIQSEEARLLAEEHVSNQRARGIADEQILREVERGELSSRPEIHLER